jgi:hypothetical protein
LRSVECLDLRLLVHTQDHRVVRRRHVQTNDVTNFLDELRILGQLKALRSVRLEAKRMPDPLHTALPDPNGLGEVSRAPMRCAFRRRLQRPDDRSLDVVIANRTWRARARLIDQPLESTLRESSTPFSDGMCGYPEPLGHFLIL